MTTATEGRDDRMDCAQTLSLLGALLFDEVEPDRERSMRAHIDMCNACRDQAEKMKSTAALLKEGLAAGGPVLSDAKRERVLRVTRPPRRALRMIMASPIFHSAAILLIGLTVAWFTFAVDDEGHIWSEGALEDTGVDFAEEPSTRGPAFDQPARPPDAPRLTGVHTVTVNSLDVVPPQDMISLNGPGRGGAATFGYAPEESMPPSGPVAAGLRQRLLSGRRPIAERDANGDPADAGPDAVEPDILGEGELHVLGAVANHRPFVDVSGNWQPSEGVSTGTVDRESSARSEHYREVGERFLKEMKYQDARRALLRASSLDPENKKAAQDLDRVNKVLGLRTPDVRTALEKLAGERTVVIQEKLVDLDNSLKHAQKTLEKGRVVDADASLSPERKLAEQVRLANRAVEHAERAREVIKWMPYEVSVRDQKAQADRLLREARELSASKTAALREAKIRTGRHVVDVSGRKGADEKKRKAAEALEREAHLASLARDAAADAAHALKKQAKRSMDDLEYAQALAVLQRAAELNPNDGEVRSELAKVRAALGQRRDWVAAGLEHLSREKQVNITESLMELQRSTVEAKRKSERATKLRAMGDHDAADAALEDAKKHYTRVAEIIRWMPYQVDLRNEEQEILAGLEDVHSRIAARKRTEDARAARVDTDGAMREDAFSFENTSRNSEEERRQRDERIAKLFDEAQDLYMMGRLEDAERAATEVLKIDPTNYRANELWVVSREGQHRDRERASRGDRESGKLLSDEQRAEASVPYNDYLVYPDDWDAISQREASESQDAKEHGREEAVDVKSHRDLLVERGKKTGEDESGAENVKLELLRKLALKQQQALEVARDNLRNAENQRIEMENELNNSRQQLAAAEQQKNRLEKDLHHNSWIIQSMMDHGVPVREIVWSGEPTGPVSPVEGKVLAVRKDVDRETLSRWVSEGASCSAEKDAAAEPSVTGKVLAVRPEVNLAMLSLGSNDGVKKGYRFTVSRGEDYVQKVEVEKVFSDMCSARLLTDWVGKAIKKGDTVTLGNTFTPEPEPRSPRELEADELLGKETPGDDARESTSEAKPEAEGDAGDEAETVAFVTLTEDEARAMDAEAERGAAKARAAETKTAKDESVEDEPDEKVAEEDALPQEDEDLPPPPVNPFVLTARDPLSTFAMDVDVASYNIARTYIRNGRLPPRRTVRMEEFVNAFDYNYPRQSREAFSVHVEGMPAPFGKGLELLKIGVRARDVGRAGRKNAHLVFVVDCSGSMDMPDRLPLVKESLSLLLGELGARDRVSLVAYGTRPLILLEGVSAAEKDRVAGALSKLRCTGSTNLAEGIKAGYEIAHRQFRAGDVNRVVLCTDGVANVGDAEADRILANVASYRENGVTLTAAGFGAGAYDDAMLASLAGSGDGNYLFIDSIDAARRAFVEQLAATIQVVARDAKIQVAFDPAVVRRYRLVGYESRDIADADFRNDAVDAGEVGSGQSVTALYEIERERDAPRSDLGTVYVRYQDVDTKAVDETSRRIGPDVVAARTPEKSPRLFVAACAAEFAEVLRGSEHASGARLDPVLRLITRASSALPLDERVHELVTLVSRAKGLRGER